MADIATVGHVSAWVPMAMTLLAVVTLRPAHTAQGRVEGAGSVAKKRVHAVGRVLGANGVTLKRTYTIGRVDECP